MLVYTRLVYTSSTSVLSVTRTLGVICTKQTSDSNCVHVTRILDVVCRFAEVIQASQLSEKYLLFRKQTDLFIQLDYFDLNVF